MGKFIQQFKTLIGLNKPQTKEFYHFPFEAPTIKFLKLSDAAIIPTKAHFTDSGYDLFTAADMYIMPGETVIIPTDIAVALPYGYEAQVRPRSGVTSKTTLRVQLGTIDNAYRGNIGIIVDNISMVSGGTVFLPKGYKLAQLVVQSLPYLQSIEVDQLDETDRGQNGFGSTGV